MSELSHRLATTWLLGLLCLASVVLSVQHAAMPLPPHSSHDGFLLVPQLQHLIAGATPDDSRFGMFHSTWFSPHALKTGALGWSGFVDRILGNVQSHTWIDAPHPLALMAFVSFLLGGGTWAPFLVQLGYLAALVFSLYAIGARVHSRSVGLMAGVLALGAPAVFGMVQFIEPHLALASMSTMVVALLIHTDGLTRPLMALLASLAIWSLSRTGEGSGDAVIAGLVVIGPTIVAIAGASRTASPVRVLVSLGALVIPFLLLADLSWMLAAMERVTRAFADPAVQSDVVEKGGVLSNPLVWSGAYLVMLVTDYLRPLLMVCVLVGLYGLRLTGMRHRWSVLLWVAIPWLALSWMQRKAAWYGIALVPPVLLCASIGLHQLRWPGVRRLAAGVALLQLCLLSLVPASATPTALSWLREPLELHQWRLRRVDLLRPMDTAGNHRLLDDLERLVDWGKTQRELGPIAIMTLGTQNDYATRYYLAMELAGAEVVNLGDPRLRARRYRSLNPNDFSAFIFLDDGAQPWPPTAAQRVWLTENLRCEDGDAFDAFVAAIVARSQTRRDGFYPLSGAVDGVLGPGQVWTGAQPQGGLCDP